MFLGQGDSGASYNGFGFSNAVQTVGLKIRPVPDSSGRTFTHSVFTFSLKDTLTVPDGSTVDSTVQSIYRRLMAPAGHLVYRAKGIGNDFEVNAPGGEGRRDVAWGPKPVDIAFTVHGKPCLAVEFVWTVEVAIPVCEDAVFKGPMAFLEFNFSLKFSKDRGGYQTRTYAGHLVIPLTRPAVDDRTVADDADAYRERVVPKLPPGFRREREDYDLSEDRRRLDFVVTDEEMPPNVPPPGVIEVSADLSFQTSQKSIFQWAGVFNATYELAREVHRSDAFPYFLQTLKDKIKVALANAQVRPANGGPAPGREKESTVVLTGLRLAEPEIHGRKGAAFTASWTFACDLRHIVAASGLWRPVPGTDWQRWAASLANTAHHPRGNAKLRYDRGQEIIIDLCGAKRPRVLQAKATELKPRGGHGEAFLQAAPQPATSWLRYKCFLLVEPEDNTTFHQPLPDTSVRPVTVTLSGQYLQSEPIHQVNAGGFQAHVLAGKIVSVTKPFTLGYLVNNQVPKNRVQRRGPPQVWVTLIGSALRAGYYIAAPQVAQVAGATAESANRAGREYFVHGMVGNWLGVPIVGAKWRLRWKLTSPPQGGIGLPFNPFLGN